MGDLKCTRCGKTASYADAQIADMRTTCDATERMPNESGRYDGHKHNWIEV